MSQPGRLIILEISGENSDLLVEGGVFAQLGHELIEGELASFVERKHEILRHLDGGRELGAVDREKV